MGPDLLGPAPPWWIPSTGSQGRLRRACNRCRLMVGVGGWGGCLVLPTEAPTACPVRARGFLEALEFCMPIPILCTKSRDQGRRTRTRVLPRPACLLLEKARARCAARRCNEPR